MAQIEVVPGKPDTNAKKMIDCIKMAQEGNADIIVFPELCIPGYLIGDTWERPSFLKECEMAERDVIANTKGICAVFGNVRIEQTEKNEDGRVRKYNAAVVAIDGKNIDGPNNIVAVKTLMPNYREFDDSRHFYDSRKVLFDAIHTYEKEKSNTQRNVGIREAANKLYSPFSYEGLKIGVLLCEDAWDADYAFSPMEYLAPKSDIIINISCSPFTFGKNNKRNRVFAAQAKKYQKPMIYVNNVGLQNNGKTIYTFDGNSCIYDRSGNQLNLCSSFDEGCDIVEIDIDSDFGYPVDDKDDDSTLYDAIIYGTKKFMEQQSVKKIVIGASGGIDSCLAAAIYSQAVENPQDLILVNMPYKYNSQTTIGIAEKLAKNIGCQYVSIPINSLVNDITSITGAAGFKFTPFMLENVQSRARLQVLAAVAAQVGGVFTCNSNKSEATVGYCTFYGDLGGFMANIADLWKTQVYNLAMFFNEHVKDVIPEEAFTVTPSAELSPDQDVDKGMGDPLNYPYHDRLFRSWVERWNRATPKDNLKWYDNDTIDKEIGFYGVKRLFPTREEFEKDLYRWWNLYNGIAVAKRVQCPPILAVSCRSYGFDHREYISVR